MFGVMSLDVKSESLRHGARSLRPDRVHKFVLPRVRYAAYIEGGTGLHWNWPYPCLHWKKLGKLIPTLTSCKHKPEKTLWTSYTHQNRPKARFNHLSYLPKHKNTLLLQKQGQFCNLTSTIHSTRALWLKPFQIYSISSIRTIPSLKPKL